MWARVINYFKPKTFKARLDAIHYPPLFIPDKYCCTISHEIMDEPLMLDPRDHDHIVDRAELDKFWAFSNRTGAKINPHTNLPIETAPVYLRALRDEIERFVTEKEQLAAAIKATFNRIHKIIAARPYSYLGRLLNIHFPKEDIPESFMKFNNVMNYPIMLDGEILDFVTYHAICETHPECIFMNPFSHKEIMSFYEAEKLQVAIEAFVSIQEWKAVNSHVPDADIVTKLAAIKNKIEGMREPLRHHEKLEQQGYPHEEIPKRFIAHNFSGQIMTHPVKIDEKYVVDFNELSAWWSDPQHPENRLINFYTGLPIKQIEYDDALKKNLDEFVNDPKLFLKKLQSQPFNLSTAHPSFFFTRMQFLGVSGERSAKELEPGYSGEMKNLK